MTGGFSLLRADEKCGLDNLYAKELDRLSYFIDNCEFSKDDINPDCKGGGVCKPIILAALDGDVERVRLLVKGGADINANGGGATGDTPLIISIMNGNRELALFLAETGADVNKPNNFGATPFWGVSSMGDTELTQLFIEHGAKVDTGGRFPDPLGQQKGIVEGITPLMMAARSSHLEMVRLLLKNKANPELKDSLGRTAADYAEYIHKEILKELSAEQGTIDPK